MPYYHLTNLQSPVSSVDGAFLDVLKDYRIGPPVEAKVEGANSVEVMVSSGVFGVYATPERMNTDEVKKYCGLNGAQLGKEVLSG